MTNPLGTFREKCVFTNAYVGDGFVNYKQDNFSPRDSAFLLRTANRVIEENELPLKAEIIGKPLRCILQITEK